ncbi:hypothetical protein HaLaN_30314 [Haematococcus lacustris]|uniref:Uncharacterized protein n=1 Tax=Haematococcus lacustris TaxID=44745 RepID=A0A6A0AEJ0_HAELA|nr:hypothetical protein HaLaN_30314 [Haematococcus lacustris]
MQASYFVQLEQAREASRWLATHAEWKGMHLALWLTTLDEAHAQGLRHTTSWRSNRPHWHFDCPGSNCALRVAH